MRVPQLLWCLLAIGLAAGHLMAGSSSQYWTNAQSVHAYIATNLLTSAGSYRIHTNSQTSYEWYNASHIYADAAMVLGGDKNYVRSMTNTFAWMSHLWDGSNRTLGGGYYAAAAINGQGAGGGKYVDDNALAGNVYLDCYEVATGADKTNFLNAAMATANWLMYSGQWDNTFGGGFWWDTTKQNKPTQSNGLALQLFLRLYQLTGKPYYRSWASSVQGWLDSQMFNRTNGVYVWQIVTNGTPQGAKSSIVFTYDNAIMIEAELLGRPVFGANAYLVKAQTLASNLNATLWNNNYGSYYFNTTDGRVNPCWCGWASQSMIKLYQADGNPTWLSYARRNIDFMNSRLRNWQIGAYYQYCNMDGSHLQATIEGVDQAWMQRIQAMLSQYR